MTQIREDLLAAKDSELRMLAAGATHQHFKGGLYHLHGAAMNTDTGAVDRMCYEHYYPFKRMVYHRSIDEFDGLVETPEYHPMYGQSDKIKRFRKLGEGW